MTEENKQPEKASEEHLTAIEAEAAEQASSTSATDASSAEPAASSQEAPAKAAATTPAPTVSIPDTPPEAAAPPAASADTPPAPAPERRKETDEEKAARRKAALEAREAAKAAAAQAAAEATKAAQTGATTADSAAGDAADAPPPKPPSPNQPRLDQLVGLLRERIEPDIIEEAYINEQNDHLPTLSLKQEGWLQAAGMLRDHPELGCTYLRNISGVDYETYMEVVYYPWNIVQGFGYCIKVKTDREQPSVPSVTPLWETANWNEREIYDLLGIDFPGHPDLRRIMMPDDWIGHPLRKDYVPLDPEV